MACMIVLNRSNINLMEYFAPKLYVANCEDCTNSIALAAAESNVAMTMVHQEFEHD